MPKDRRVNSSSFDRAMVSPYSCSSKISNCTTCETFSPHVGDEREWEEARCPICIEHPHNAVLLLCSSREKGCRPFICDTSYRHSNCFDQFRKSSSSSSSWLSSQEQQKSQLVCPLCRGEITGWEIVHPARFFMNSKTRSCSLETCGFSGNYTELRKHARLEHPFERPSEASPIQRSDWMMLEQRMEMEDALAHQSDIEYDLDGWLSWDEWGENGLWSDGSFFDFPSGMSDIEDGLIDEMFSGLSMSFMSLHSSFPEEELMDSGSSRNIVSGNRSDNLVENGLPSSMSDTQVTNSPLQILRSISSPSYHSDDGAATNSRSRSNRRENGSNNVRYRSRSTNRMETGLSEVPFRSRSRSSYRRENAPTNVRYRSRSTNRRENGSTAVRFRSRSSYRRENGSTNVRYRSRSSNRGENGSINVRSRSRSSNRGENVSTDVQSRLSYHSQNGSTRTRSSHPGEDGSISRSSYRRENVLSSSQTRTSYRGDYTQTASRQAHSNFRRRVA